MPALQRDLGLRLRPGSNDAAIIITNWRPDEAFIQTW